VKNDVYEKKVSFAETAVNGSRLLATRKADLATSVISL
jgi:hypothetical protein